MWPSSPLGFHLRLFSLLSTWWPHRPGSVSPPSHAPYYLRALAGALPSAGMLFLLSVYFANSCSFCQSQLKGHFIGEALLHSQTRLGRSGMVPHPFLPSLPNCS